MLKLARPSVVCLFVLLSVCSLSPTLAAPAAGIGNFGPTGIDIDVTKDHTLKVTAVQPGSPADGKLQAGDIITAINQHPPLKDIDETKLFATRSKLASFITEAEATDGKLAFSITRDGKALQEPVIVTIPALGSYSDTWPVECDKTSQIIRKNANRITANMKANPDAYSQHNLENGFAILMLLSTGEQKDVDTVRDLYQDRMRNFDAAKEIGSHSWHNGVQGVAACEYYLRTGDDTVMPLINAICAAAAKYEVQGGWTHWAKGVNPQYTAGGLLNAAGTQLLTTLLLAKQCGADVDEQTLQDSLRFFYRFAGRGNSPYGDHRPESGLTDNGKTSMLALAMNAAAANENPKAYEMARDAAALYSLYNYEALLRGHTGGLGTLWFGPAAALLADEKPELYRNRLDNIQWYYELSRRHDGLFGSSGAGRYDNTGYGHAVGLGLTAPRQTLQITGAPRSPHAKSFTLPEIPWGRESDLAFFTIDGGKNYQPTGKPPHQEITNLDQATDEQLRSLASHPYNTFRRHVAAFLSDEGKTELIEELLTSDDPLARHTGAVACNAYEPWQLRFSVGARAKHSLEPDEFTPEMFEALMAMITDPKQPLWLVDQSLLALAAAKPEQVKSRLNDILPYVEHDEWWLREAAAVGLTPAMQDQEAMEIILPKLTQGIATNMHAKGRGGMSWHLKLGTENASDDIKKMVRDARVKIFEITPKIPDPEPGVDHSGITSCALLAAVNGMSWTQDAEGMVAISKVAAKRIDDLRPRELHEQIKAMIAAESFLNQEQQRIVGNILEQAYRPAVIGDDPAALQQAMESMDKRGLNAMNQLLAIKRMVGKPGGWEVFGRDQEGMIKRYFTSFEPDEKPDDSAYNRYRDVKLPTRLQGWYAVDYNPATHGWSYQMYPFAATAPAGYSGNAMWREQFLPKSGEVVFMRRTFELDNLDFAAIRMSVYSRQGYDVYLNGKLLQKATNRSKTWQARQTYFDQDMRKHLKVGKNILAARGFLQYFRGPDGGIEVILEGLEEFPSVE